MRVPQASELQPARQWSAVLAAALDQITDHVGAAARRLADAWPDARGQEWTDRLHALHSALEQHAAAAADLGSAIDHAADDVDTGTAQYGPQLGGTDARRVNDRRGVTIPWWNDPTSDDG